MQADIAKLKGDMQAAQKNLAKQQAALQEQMGYADAKIKEVARTLETLRRASGQTVAGLDVKLEEIKSRIQELQGQMEVRGHRLDQVGTQVDDLAKRLEGLETTLPAAGDTDSDRGGAGDRPKDKKGLVAYGKRLLKTGKLDDARSAFREVVRRWPKDGGITDDAYFQLGETYYREKNHRSALQEYVKVVEKFPKGRYVDDAYYRIGECTLALNRLEDAEIFFSEIVKNHPRSPLVKNAKRRLEEVRAKSKKQGRKK